MNGYIHKKIEEANSAFSMFCKGDRILVALSGGADSVALLLSLKKFVPVISLYACHVNHMLRGEEADRDMFFAKELCEKNGILLETLKTDVAAYAKASGLSTELAARNVRYRFFEEVCKKHGINKVATAHTLSDNAETVLFNLTRGTGLQGLCGIPPIRELCEGITLIRPLIYVKRSDVEAFLDSISQGYVTDSSNLTDDYTRNYFRHSIIPLLKNVNPSFEESLGKTCSSLYKAQRFIDNAAEVSITNEISELSRLDDCVLANVVMKLYSDYSENTLIEKVHIDEIIGLIKKSAEENFKRSYEICLPEKTSAFIKDGVLSFAPTVRNKNVDSYEYCIIPVPGINYINGTRFAFAVSEDTLSVPEGLSLYCAETIDKSAIDGQLYVRNRRCGDTVKHGGMTKKVKDLMNHSKIPAEIKPPLPFICDGSGIILIPGVVKSDSHKSGCINDENKLYVYIFTQTTQ